MEFVKGGGDMIVAFDGWKYEASKCILNPLKTREGAVGKTKEKRVAIVKA